MKKAVSNMASIRKFTALASEVVDPESVASEVVAAIHHSRHRKSPAKKLADALDIEAGLVFADPDNAHVIRTWARRVLSRQFPQALRLTDAHVDLISAFAKRIGKLVTNTGDEKADLLTQVGGYVIRDLQHKLDVVDRTLTLKLDKQQLTIPLPKQFNSGAPSRTIDEDAPHPNDAIERISTRPRPGGR
jgi:DNA-binding response OmpR family regulator